MRGDCISTFFNTGQDAPLELRFDHRWLTTTGAIVIRLGGREIYRLDAAGTIGTAFSRVQKVLTDPALRSPFLQKLEICLEPGGARIQVANFILRRAPELDGPQLNVSVPPTGAESVPFTWTSRVGQSYQLQVRSSLTTGTWEPVGAPIAGTGENQTTSVPPADPVGTRVLPRGSLPLVVTRPSLGYRLSAIAYWLSATASPLGS